MQDKPKAYVASGINNYDQVLNLEEQIVKHGGWLTFSWATDVLLSRKIGTTDDEARRRELAVIELHAVLQADALLLVLPGGRGSHVELGMACALNKPVVILNEQSDLDVLFYLLPNVKVFREEKAALSTFLSLLGLEAV